MARKYRVKTLIPGLDLLKPGMIIEQEQDGVYRVIVDGNKYDVKPVEGSPYFEYCGDPEDEPVAGNLPPLVPKTPARAGLRILEPQKNNDDFLVANRDVITEFLKYLLNYVENMKP